MSRFVFSGMLACLLAVVGPPALGQDSAVTLPQLGDDYSRYVAQLERGETAIDYMAFRQSFLGSEQFRIKGSSNYDDLKAKLEETVRTRDLAGVMRNTKLLLDIDYTSMLAHKYRQQTFKILGDDVNQKKYHEIEFGLLNSIVRSGDGKTCGTAWPVIQIEEEYFILKMSNAALESQRTTTDGGLCDEMTVKTDEGERTYFFDVSRIFEKRREMLDKGTK